jgi:arylsulfatase A-like enzyme
MKKDYPALYSLLAILLFSLCALTTDAQKKPNIVVIMGDDIGWYNPSCYNRGDMGYKTPNIDRIAREGALFTTWYGQQSCTAGRAAFITGQSPIRTGLTKVGLPGADIGLSPLDPSIAEFMKSYGYATGQFGKNHLGDLNKFLPTVHGFDEFFGNLYHLNAEEEPENPDYPKMPEFKKKFGLYWSDDGDLFAIRVKDWKISFIEQYEQGLSIWDKDYTRLRAPNLYNLRADPFERGTYSSWYPDWKGKRIFLIVPAQAIVG